MQKPIQELEQILGFKFHQRQLLESSMVHRSYLNEHPNFHLEQNERLEFLGDAVLELIVTDYLYHNFHNPEGELTNWRASLVRGATLKQIADQLKLGEYLYLSKGEELSGGRQRELILANSVEALIGAIYLDQGYDAASKFIHDYIIVRLPEIIKNKTYLDSKSRLQELSQEKLGMTPIYQVISESGPDHAKTFVMGVYLDNREYGQGVGSSKQIAEQEAAHQALENWSAE